MKVRSVFPHFLFFVLRVFLSVCFVQPRAQPTTTFLCRATVVINEHHLATELKIVPEPRAPDHLTRCTSWLPRHATVEASLPTATRYGWAEVALRGQRFLYWYALSSPAIIFCLSVTTTEVVIELSSQVTFIYIALLTIKIVSKHCTISKQEHFWVKGIFIIEFSDVMSSSVQFKYICAYSSLWYRWKWSVPNLSKPEATAAKN